MRDEILAVGLGSNLGDRLVHLRGGVRTLGAWMNITACSSVYETAPVGDLDQGPFLNMVVLGTTETDPIDFLDVAVRAEESAGRVRTRRWGPRTLDVDLILWGRRVISDPGLTVPHPRWKERSFVLAPLAEVGGDLVDPESGDSVASIWAKRGPEMEPATVRHAPGEVAGCPGSAAGGVR